MRVVPANDVPSDAGAITRMDPIIMTNFDANIRGMAKMSKTKLEFPLCWTRKMKRKYPATVNQIFLSFRMKLFNKVTGYNNACTILKTQG